jgi:transcriptional regulator with XRE-family HTH domain
MKRLPGEKPAAIKVSPHEPLCAGRHLQSLPPRLDDALRNLAAARPWREAESPMTITGQQVKAARALLGWTQDRLAGETGVSASTVGTFESGKRRLAAPSIAMIQRALEVEGVEFVEGELAREDQKAVAMSNKPTKTKEELASLITEWLKSRPECAGVTDVAMAPMVRISDDSPNWHAAFIMAEGDAVPETAVQLVDRMTAEFDIA